MSIGDLIGSVSNDQQEIDCYELIKLMKNYVRLGKYKTGKSFLNVELLLDNNEGNALKVLIVSIVNWLKNYHLMNE